MSSEGLDYKAILDYARNVGGPALRKMTFQERGRMLKALALHLTSIKRQFYDVSWATGLPRWTAGLILKGYRQLIRQCIPQTPIPRPSLLR